MVGPVHSAELAATTSYRGFRLGQPSLGDRRNGLVGRRTELAELIDFLGRTRSGKLLTQVVEVTGDAGIGKTAVLSEFTMTARATDALVLSGRAERGAQSTPFSLFADCFHDHDDLRQAVLAARQLDDDGAAIRQAMEQLAGTRLVVVLDDLHAGDNASTSLLAGMLRRPLRANVLFVLGYRDRQACSGLRPAVANRDQQVAAARIRLAPLTETDVDELLAGQHTASWRRRIYRDSGGNPAYLHGLIAERPAFSPYLDPAGADEGARAGDYAVFLAELEGTSPLVRDVAHAAAVVGNDFEAELVARMLDRPASVVLGAIGELISRDLVYPVVRGQYFAFRHPVLRRAIYSGTELSRRVQLHISADGVLRDRGVSAIERAPHVEQWAKYGDLEAVEVLGTAGQTITLTEPNTAAAWLKTALRVLPRHPDHREKRGRLLVRLAKARGASGHLRECRDLAHEALRILPKQPTTIHAKVVAFTAMVQRMLGTYAETDAMLRAEVTALGDDDSQSCALLKFEIAAGELSNDDPTGCCDWARQALTIAVAHNLRSLQAACHGLMAMAYATSGDTTTAARHLDQSATLLDGMLDAQFALSTDAVVWTGWSEVLLERWDDAQRHFEKAVDFATRSGHRLALPHLLVGQMFTLRNRGLLAETHTATEHAIYLAQESGSPDHVVTAYSMQAWTDTMMGRFDDALEKDAIATCHARDSAHGWCETMALRMLAEARLLVGDQEGCMALAATIGGPNLEAADVCSRVAWYELLTRAELAAGRVDEAAKWAESATVAAVLLGQPGRTALAHLAEAQVLLAQDPEEALSSAQWAVTGLENAGMAMDALRARVVLGVALWHQNRLDDSARQLKLAQQAFEQLGATTLARMARTDRRRLAARAPRDKTTCLTGRERQVANLVQEGLTNRQIARRLNIAEKTVEMHLSKVFAKLGVSSRAAVATYVTQEHSAPVGHGPL